MSEKKTKRLYRKGIRRDVLLGYFSACLISSDFAFKCITICNFQNLFCAAGKGSLGTPPTVPPRISPNTVNLKLI